MSELGILNVGAGDTKLVFDPSKPEESKKAAAIVRDMIRRGYAILIEVKDEYGPPGYQRVHDFDPNTYEYIIGDIKPEKIDGRSKEARAARGATRRIPAARARGVSVGRTAGG